MSTEHPGKTTVARFGNKAFLVLQVLHFSNLPAETTRSGLGTRIQRGKVDGETRKV